MITKTKYSDKQKSMNVLKKQILFLKKFTLFSTNIIVYYKIYLKIYFHILLGRTSNLFFF